MMNIKQLKEALNTRTDKSAWSKAVTLYAYELIEDLNDDITLGSNRKTDEKLLLNGATSWSEFSYGGSSLIYDCDIAERVCNPSEYKKTREGERNPNKNENWLDCQARALYQAFQLIRRITKYDYNK